MLIQSHGLHLQIEKDKDGVDDLMKEVLGPEHPGRTRAVGYNVTLKESRKNQRNGKQHELPDIEDLVTKLEDRLFQRIYDKIYAKLMADMVPNMMAKGMDTEKDVVDSMDGSRVNPTMMPQDGAGNNEEIEVRSPNIKKTGAVSPILGELDNINVCIFYSYKLRTIM